VEDLEEAWLKHLRDTRNQPDTLLAQDQGKTPGRATGRNIVRLTVPPVQPLGAAPVVRGAMPNNDQVGQRFSAPAFEQGPTWRPVYPVPASPVTFAAPPPPPPGPNGQSPIPVHLGTPQFGPDPNGVPSGASPVGFPTQ
jgi:hypothetical protein